MWNADPRVAFRDSGVLLEIVDYVERNALPCDSARMQEIRTAALELRIASTRAIIGQIFSR